MSISMSKSIGTSIRNCLFEEEVDGLRSGSYTVTFKHVDGLTQY